MWKNEIRNIPLTLLIKKKYDGHLKIQLIKFDEDYNYFRQYEKRNIH